MCRITGFLSPTGRDGGSNLRVLEAMRDSLAAGGPDDAGDYFDGPLALGHRRLAIIDVSASGHQPFISTCGRYVIDYNGEVYNHAELRARMAAKGRQFRSHCDTEVLLYLMAEEGIAGLARVRGMFAFAFYDREEKKLLLARDRAGVKPLFYYQHGGWIAFASELKAFHELPDFDREIDEVGRDLYFRHGYISGERTIFRYVKKVPPGGYVRIDCSGHHCDDAQLWWNVADAYNQPRFSGSYEDALGRVEELLVESARLRLVSDVPVGLFLSGGIDSSVLLAVLAKSGAARLSTFTIGFAEAGYDESEQARAVAGWFGSDHAEMRVTERECKEVIGELPQIWDEPNCDSSQIPTLLLARFARRKVKVAMSAEGGDEIFYGYEKYQRCEDYFARIHRSSGVVRALRLVPPRLLLRAGEARGVGNRLLKLREAAAADSIDATFAVGDQMFTPYERARLFGQAPAEKNTVWGQHAWAQDLAGIDRMLSMDFQGYLAEDILTKVDRATMSVGLEGREPMLDHKLVEFAASLPIDYKRSALKTKRPLRDILAKHAPAHLVLGPKKGFAVPVEKWMRDDPVLRASFIAALSPENLSSVGMNDPSDIGRLLRRYLRGADGGFKRLWTVYNYQRWWQRWMVR